MTIQLDRTQAPAFKAIDRFELLADTRSCLKNNIPLHCISAGEQDVLRVDITFEAGDWQQSKPLVASVTGNMLLEGSQQFGAAEIAEKLDYLGSHTSVSVGKHSASLSLYCLNKHLGESLRLVADVLHNPAFAEKELTTYRAKRKQQYLVDDSRVEIRSQKLFSNALFGSNHPYGAIPLATDYDEITRRDLEQFHAANYLPSHCSVLLAGRITDAQVQLVEQFIGGTPSVLPRNEKQHQAPQSSAQQVIYEQRADAVQTSVRIGKPFITKTHPDYAGLQVLNTVLGGYFGSRLMQNIREDKGFTYGIGSGLLSNRYGGYFTVVTEVGAPVRQAAIAEIYKEITRLCTDLIPESELEVVRNYIIASTLRNFDGALATADSIKAILDYNLTVDYYYQLIHTAQSISPQQLRTLAEKYFGDGQFWEVSVG